MRVPLGDAGYEGQVTGGLGMKRPNVEHEIEDWKVSVVGALRRYGLKCSWNAFKDRLYFSDGTPFEVHLCRDQAIWDIMITIFVNGVALKDLERDFPSDKLLGQLHMLVG